MSVRAYLLLSFALTAIDCIGVTLWQMYTGDFSIVPAVILAAKLILDGVFVGAHWTRIRLTKFEFLMVIWVTFGAIMGIAQWLLDDPAFSLSRVFKDTLPAILFFLKIPIFRRYFEVTDLRYGWIVLVSLLISCANVLVFYGLGGSDTMYIGLTPPVSPALAGAVVYSSASLYLLAMVIIYFSGKRSYLVSAGLYLAWLLTSSRRLKGVLKRAFLWRILAGASLCLALSFTVSNPVSDKLTTTVSALMTSDDTAGDVPTTVNSGVDIDNESVQQGLYLATAGRSAEVITVIEGMTRFNWFLGHGAGFTYTLNLLDGTIREKYANVHFSPLGLTYKYGLPFALLFYAWIFKDIFIKRGDAKSVLFWKGIAFLMVIQSFFAFNFFVEFLLPIALAAIHAWRRNLEFNELRMIRIEPKIA